MKAVRLFWYLLLLTLPFGVRTFISGPTSFNEYASIFLYASDIALILFVCAVLPDLYRSARALPWRGTLLAMVVLAGASLAVAGSLTLGVVAFVRLLLCIGAAVGARRLLKDGSVLNVTLAIVALLALFQATVAIMQFTGQGPLGLRMLGESPISIADPGTAKIVVEGVKLIRAYGTMPDPNILAGFLLLGLCALAYLFIKADKGLYVDAFDRTKSVSVNFQRYVLNRLLYGRIVASAAMFIVAMGLVFTFSRSGWASAALALAIMFIVSIRSAGRGAARFFALMLIIGGSLYFFFAPFIMARAGLSAQEPSVSYRVAYTKIGIESITAHPILGVGIGNQVGASVVEGRYAAHGMTRAWESQPVHNLYLLIASEIGILGALAFCIFLVIVMKRLISDKSLEAGFALALLIGLLVFGLFDHFLWDIQAGRLMLWLAIAVALSRTAETGAQQ